MKISTQKTIHLPEEIINQLNLIARNLHKKSKSAQLFLFGSRVNGDYSERSDIDIGFFGKNISFKRKIEIEEAIEDLTTLNKIDFVDFSQTSCEFKKYALNNIYIFDKNGESQNTISAIQKSTSKI
jgi:predicted nucleotidyltransferase